MPMKFTIRPETKDDHADVAHIVKRAFTEGPRGYSGESELVDKIRMTEGFIPNLSLVAVQEEVVIGHILISRVFIETDEKKIPTLILAPVAVMPEFQDQGVGGDLIRAAHTIALDMNEPHIFLLGHAAYYPRFGYQPSRYLGITFPGGMDNDNCMGIEIIANSLEGVQGELEYSKPFHEI